MFGIAVDWRTFTDCAFIATCTLEEYDYLGVSTVVRRAHPQPAVDMTYIGSPGAGGDQYAGLDEFGRVVDLLWVETTGPTALEHIQHSYDLLGNRLTRATSPLATSPLATSPLAISPRQRYHRPYPA